MIVLDFTVDQIIILFFSYGFTVLKFRVLVDVWTVVKLFSLKSCFSSTIIK